MSKKNIKKTDAPYYLEGVTDMCDGGAHIIGDNWRLCALSFGKRSYIKYGDKCGDYVCFPLGSAAI